MQTLTLTNYPVRFYIHLSNQTNNLNKCKRNVYRKVNSIEYSEFRFSIQNL